MEYRLYPRCAFCRQLVDPDNLDEVAYHSQRGPHPKLDGFPDDGLETIPLDFRGVQPRSWADPDPASWKPPGADQPRANNARRGRRRKRDFLADHGGSRRSPAKFS